MFTGIIEAEAIITEISAQGTNRTFTFESTVSQELKIDQSLSHNGVCLTVETTEGVSYKVTAINETLKKSTLGSCNVGDTINLERCVRLNDRLDGHLVQGHVDCTAECISLSDSGGSWEFIFSLPEGFSHLIINKGSIAVNGVSLTCYDVSEKSFAVSIIPYTFDHTNFRFLTIGQSVNIEFDMIGKYIARMKSLR